MLSFEQLETLTKEEREHYATLEGEEKESFEYFYGFAYGTKEAVSITNEEAQLYRDATDRITVKAVCQLVGFVPHAGQQPIIHALDNRKDLNSFVIAAGRRFGKSASLSIIALRELLVPFSSTVLVAPTFSNAKIIFTEVLKLVAKLQLPVKTMNRGQFNFTLENGARFTANSAANIESALGGNFSLCLFEEFQSTAGGADIHKQMIAPTMLDFGTRDSGVLYARQFFIGTSRGMDSQLYDYYTKEEVLPNWKSFTAPSMTNPTLPQEYFEQMKLELGDMLYSQEILAKFLGSEDGVFHSFDKVVNTYTNEAPPRVLPEGKTLRNYYTPPKDATYICGIDIGWSDSTANVFIYRTPEGRYYVQEAYSKNMTTTEQHIKNYREIEDSLEGINDARFCDPAAAQTINDYITTYDYHVMPAKNDVKPSLQYLNVLFARTGASQEPRLYIHEDLKELIRQLSRVRYKADNGKSSKEPFIKDPDGTHWDLIAALRYALFSDQYNVASINIITN